MQRIADGRRHDDDHDDDDEQLDVRGLADRNARSISRNGQVTFTTIHPGWYAGRATHIHVDVYRSGTIVKSTQMAFSEDVTRAVYGSGVYASKGQNSTSNAGDMVFADSLADELVTITGGSTTTGYTATFRVGISV